VPKCFPTKKKIGGMRKERTLFETVGNETAAGFQGKHRGNSEQGEAYRRGTRRKSMP
jgi:hypothetical protein